MFKTLTDNILKTDAYLYLSRHSSQPKCKTLKSHNKGMRTRNDPQTPNPKHYTISSIDFLTVSSQPMNPPNSYDLNNRFLFLLVLSVGQRLCINFFDPEENFLTTLRSHLDVTFSCYFWSTLFNVDVLYIYIYIYKL